jgi:hypothetical protein
MRKWKQKKKGKFLSEALDFVSFFFLWLSSSVSLELLVSCCEWSEMRWSEQNYNPWKFADNPKEIREVEKRNMSSKMLLLLRVNAIIIFQAENVAKKNMFMVIQYFTRFIKREFKGIWDVYKRIKISLRWQNENFALFFIVLTCYCQLILSIYILFIIENAIDKFSIYLFINNTQDNRICTENTFLVSENWYFKRLNGSLINIAWNSNNQSSVLLYDWMSNQWGKFHCLNFQVVCSCILVCFR